MFGGVGVAVGVVAVVAAVAVVVVVVVVVAVAAAVVAVVVGQQQHQQQHQVVCWKWDGLRALCAFPPCKPVRYCISPAHLLMAPSSFCPMSPHLTHANL